MDQVCDSWAKALKDSSVFKPRRRVNDAFEFDTCQCSFGFGGRSLERLLEPRSDGALPPYSRVPVSVGNLTGV